MKTNLLELKNSLLCSIYKLYPECTVRRGSEYTYFDYDDINSNVRVSNLIDLNMSYGKDEQLKKILEERNLYRTVINLRDINNLQNGIGLIIKVDNNSKNKEQYNINIYNTNNSSWYIKHYEDISSWEEQVIINDLKAFGFLFDIKKED